MNYRESTTNFKTRAAGDEPIIEGYFAVFGEMYKLWDGEFETIDRHAFDETIGEGCDARALCDHETRLVLGRVSAGTLSLSVDDHGLYGEIRVNRDDSDAMNLYARIQRGDVTQASFGFDVEDIEFQQQSDGSTVELLRKVRLYEVSVVTFPAYSATAVQARKQCSADMKRRQLEAWRQKVRSKLHGD